MDVRPVALLAAMPDAVLVCAPDGTILNANPAAEQLFGYTVHELVGLAVEGLVPPVQADVHRRHRERFSATPHAQPMITGPGISALRKDGTLVPVEVNLASADLGAGPVVVASVRDVTEGRRIQTELRASHDLMAGILGAATEQAIIATDLEGMVEVFSAGAERLLGYDVTEVVGRSASIFDAPEADFTAAWGLDRTAPVRDRVAALVDGNVAATRPWTFRTRDGGVRHVLLSVTVRWTANEPDGLIAVATDETPRREQEAELAASEERFRLAFQNAPIGVALVSLRPGETGDLLRVNHAMSAMLGRDESELLAARVQDLAHPEDVELVEVTFAAMTDGTDLAELVQHRFLHSGGQDVWVDASYSVITDQAGRPDYAICMVNDVTTRRRAEAELTYNALHDPLTGLPNRALLTEQLGLALGRAQRAGTTVGVLYLDLDHFKEVNDSFGHAAGDALLVDVAARLSSAMRESDMAGRMGGDEFVVLCEGATSDADVTATADRVGQALTIDLDTDGQQLRITASIGIARSAGADDTPEDLLRRADVAMYRAKANGRSRYEVSAHDA